MLEELDEAAISGERKQLVERLATAPLLIIDDLGMLKLPATAGKDLLEMLMRRYERASTLITSNRPVEVWRCCSATIRPSPRCSAACCTTPTSSNSAPKLANRDS